MVQHWNGLNIPSRCDEHEESLITVFDPPFCEGIRSEEPSRSVPKVAAEETNGCSFLKALDAVRPPYSLVKPHRLRIRTLPCNTTNIGYPQIMANPPGKPRSKKTLNVESPSFTPATQQTTTRNLLSTQAANAPSFTPRGLGGKWC